MVNKKQECKTNRSCIKFILLSVVTLGIYALVFYVRLGKDLNRVKEKAEIEGKPLMHAIGALFLGIITLGIVPLVWNIKVIIRTYHAANVLGTKSKGSIATSIVFNTILSWTFICPIIALHNICVTANNLGEWYNTQTKQIPEDTNGAPEESATPVSEEVTAAEPTSAPTFELPAEEPTSAPTFELPAEESTSAPTFELPAEESTPSTEDDLSSLTFVELLKKMDEYLIAIRDEFTAESIDKFEKAIDRYDDVILTLTGPVAASALGYANPYRTYIDGFRKVLQLGPRGKSEIKTMVMQVLSMNKGLLFMANM